MARILADLPEQDVEWLDRIAAEQGKSRASMLREAVSSFRGQKSGGQDVGFGLWRDHGANEDGMAFQRRQRSGQGQ